MNLVIQTMVPEMIRMTVETFQKHHILRSAEYFEKCLYEQNLGQRSIFIALIDGTPVGAVHLIYKSQYPGFYEDNIPEINDLAVVGPFRRMGIGTKLVQTCEAAARAKGYSSKGLGVGLYRDYGNAQRPYHQMGYIPDGKGLMYNNSPVPPGTQVYVDDDLLIYLVKKITAPGNLSGAEFTTMCMIHDPDSNRVVVQQRCKSWKGISFPGSHVEPGE